MTITQRTATRAEQPSATSVTGTRPGDRSSGDLVVVLFAMTCTTAQFTGPGGSWQQLCAPTQTSDGRTVAAYHQFNPGSDPAASSSGAAGAMTALCQAFPGVDHSNPIDVAAQISTGTGTTLAATGVTTVTDGAFVLSGVVAGTTSRTLTISGLTEIIQYSHNSTSRAGGLAGDVKTTAGATGTKTWGNTDGVSLAWAGFVTALRPTAPTTAAATGGLTVGGSAGVEFITALVTHYAAGGPRVGGAAGVVVPDLVLVHDAAGGLTVGGAADARVPAILTTWDGSGGPVVGGAAVTVPHTALLAFHATGGATAGGTGGIVRSRPRTVHQPGSRYWTFRYQLLDSANTPVTDLDQVVGCTVSQNWFADVKRKATFDLVESGQEIDWLTDRIKPWARLHLPPYQDDDWVEWPLGVFLLSSPTRTTDETGRVVRRVQGYDQLQVYLDDKTDARYTVAASANYVSTVTTLLGDVDMVVTASSSTLPAAMEWEPGTPKLKIINALLGAVNYQSLSFDEDGRAVVAPYVAPDRRAEEYTYADDVDTSLLLPEVEQELDLFSVPNKWVLVVSNPDRAALTATYTNSNPASPTSTVRRGRTIVDYRTEQDAADQAALDAKAERLAFEASQIYESITFSTGLNPLHSGNDVYRIRYTPLAINSAFSEAEWTLPLKAGEPMTHRARRVVSI